MQNPGHTPLPLLTAITHRTAWVYTTAPPSSLSASPPSNHKNTLSPDPMPPKDSSAAGGGKVRAKESREVVGGRGVGWGRVVGGVGVVGVVCGRVVGGVCKWGCAWWGCACGVLGERKN